MKRAWFIFALSLLFFASCTKKQVPEGQLLEGVNWRLVSITTNGQTAKLPGTFKTTAKWESGRMGGNGGCNGYGADYVIKKDTLEIGGIISTKMFCDDRSDWEGRFFEALRESKTYHITGKTLTIQTTNGGLEFVQE